MENSTVMTCFVDCLLAFLMTIDSDQMDNLECFIDFIMIINIGWLSYAIVIILYQKHTRSAAAVALMQDS